MTIEPTTERWDLVEHMAQMSWLAENPMEELGEELMRQATTFIDEEA